MRVAAIIPARYASTRLPAKLLQLLGNKSIILHTYQNTVNTGLFSEVIVATDSREIFDEITSNGGTAIMSKAEHESGTDRIAEAAATIDAEIIVNVQGDEPFISREPLSKLVGLFEDADVEMASLMTPVSEDSEILDPSCVKVVCDINGNALYFSRSPIPFVRDGSSIATPYRHLGIYGFRRQALFQFSSLPPTPLERTEKLEQLRFLEHGGKIRMAVTSFRGIAIDTQEDLEAARRLFANSD